MKRRGQDKPGRRKGGKARRSRLSAHRLFAPILGLWGAALGALVTLVLPPPMVLAAAAALGLGMLGTLAVPVLAAAAGLVMGATMLALARLLARRNGRTARAPSLAVMAMRHVRTIDPATELGSGSLDEPVEELPFAALRPEAAPAPEAAEEQALPQAEDDLPPPRSLELSEFAACPGRNAVWVSAPAPVEAAAEADEAPVAVDPEPCPAPASLHAVGSGAIELLRAVPPSELSLVQMVERFAAALHEHQAAAARSGQRADLAGRDAALAEALKALGALSGEVPEGSRGEPLRAALSRLQELRGAA